LPRLGIRGGVIEPFAGGRVDIGLDGRRSTAENENCYSF